MREILVEAEEFKDSPVGKIPKDWEVKTVASVAHLVTKGTTPTSYGFDYKDEGILFLRVENITEDGKIGSGKPIFIDNETHRFLYRSQLELGDILISIAGTIGRIAVVDSSILPANSNQAIALVRVERTQIEPSFLRWFLISEVGQQSLLSQSVQLAQANLSLGQIATTFIPVPPLCEQQGIGEILDTIDSTIAHTSSLIAKLKQMKAGLLHDLLTRGLDENGELRDAIAHPEQFKDSPLGQIPKDWLVVSVGECLARIEQGWSPDCESNNTPLGEWGVLKTTAVVWEGYQDFENKQLPSHLQPDPNYEVKRGDVLMTRAGPNSRVGVVALVRQTQGKLMLSDKLYRLIPRDYVKPDFLAYTLSGNRTQRHLSTLKTGLAESQTNISQEIVRTLLIALPKIQEQERIINILDTHDTRIRTEEAYRDKLKLQKKGLMHDLLTGKVRIKDADKFTPASDTV